MAVKTARLSRLLGTLISDMAISESVRPRYDRFVESQQIASKNERITKHFCLLIGVQGFAHNLVLDFIVILLYSQEHVRSHPNPEPD